jgi:hypothetical protein
MFIKTFKKFVRKNDKYQRKGKKRACYECGQTGHFIADCPNKKEQEAKKEYKKDKFKKGGKNKGYFKKKKYGQAHTGEEWNSDEESSSSEEEEEVANIAIQSTSSSQLFTNLHDDSYTPTCLMAKGDKVHLFNDDLINDDEEQLAMKNKMIKEFVLNGYNVITKLMEKLDKRKATLDAQEDLIILEKERNLELQELLFNKDEMLEALTKDVSLVKITIEDKEEEMTNMKTSIVSLANEKDALESSMLSLTVQNQELQVQLESCKNSNASSLLVESKASSSNNNICKHCVKYHATCCLTNHAMKERSQVKVKKTLKKCSSNDGLKKVEPKYKSLMPNSGKRGLGTTHTR